MEPRTLLGWIDLEIPMAVSEDTFIKCRCGAQEKLWHQADSQGVVTSLAGVSDALGVMR